LHTCQTNACPHHHHHKENNNNKNSNNNNGQSLPCSSSHVSAPLPFFLAAAAAAATADLPPPIVIFPTQLKVTHDDGDFRATDDQNDQHHQQKPKDVVNGVHPQRRHDEKHFNEDGPERQQASDHHGNDGVHEPDLFRDLTGDLMGLARQFVRGFGKTKVGTCAGGGGGWVVGGNEKTKET